MPGRPASTCCAADPTTRLRAHFPVRRRRPGTRREVDYFEIPIAIQDRTFTAEGALFYPDSRAFFEGLDPSQLQIPFMPDPACGGDSDVAPIWNPEFFGNSMVVNGNTWPSLDVKGRRYRFRLLNGSNSRFLILRLSNGLPFWQIGNDGGLLPARSSCRGAAGPGRARRRDRRLHGRPRRYRDGHGEPGARRAVRRREPGVDFEPPTRTRPAR